jgi:hypothetical protein
MTYFIFEKTVLANGSEFLIFNGKKVATEAETGGEKYSTEPSLEFPIPPTHAHYLGDHGMVETLPDVRAMKVGELREICELAVRDSMERKMSKLSAQYSPHERATWGLQLSEATTFISSGSSAFIESIAKSRKEKADEFARKIVMKNAEYNAAVAEVLAEYHAGMAATKAKSAKDLPKFTLSDLNIRHPNFPRFMPKNLS